MTELSSALDGVRTALDEAAGYVDAICCGLETALAALPAGTAAGAEVADLRTSFAQVAGSLGAMLTVAGDPTELRAVGRAWTDTVAAPVSRLVGLASEQALDTDDRWTGRAADAYRATLPAQRSALAAIVAICHEIDATLNELASAITKFWIALAIACLGLVLALAGALGSAAPVVGPPVAGAIALAGVGALVTAGNSALSGLTDVTLTASDRSAALVRRVADSSAFPLGAWPRSTTGIGSATGDWEIR